MDLRERLESDVSRRTLLAVGAVGLFVLLFPFGHVLVGTAVGALALLPVVAVAAAYGSRWGVVAAVLAVPTNVLLFAVVGQDGWDVVFGPSLTGHAAGAVVAYLVGRYRETLDRLSRAELAREHAVSQRLAREADLEHVVSALPTIVYRVDRELRFERSMGGGLAAFGLEPDDLVGLTLQDWMGSDDPEFPPVASAHAAFEGRSSHFDIEWGGRCYTVRVEPIRAQDGEVVAALGIATDVSAQEAQRVELEELVASQRRANEELTAINAMKDGFLQAVSHELRTPLTSVRGFASTLARHRHEMAPDAIETLFTRLIANADKLDRLLNDLLDVDRLERGIIEPRRTPVELGRLVCEIADHFDTGSRRLQLEVEDVTAWVDGPKVERVIENLLGNAVKHTPEGTSLTLALMHLPEGVRVEMRQSGVPVPDELKRAIFEPFRQGPLRTSHQPGTGIGLSLVARFAAIHEGRAWVEDTPDGGAVFCVELRADLVEAPTVPGRQRSAQV